MIGQVLAPKQGSLRDNTRVVRPAAPAIALISVSDRLQLPSARAGFDNVQRRQFRAGKNILGGTSRAARL